MNFTCWSERSVDYGAYRKRLRDNKVKFKKQSVNQPEIQKCNAENQTNQRSLLMVKKNFQAILVGLWSTSELILPHVPAESHQNKYARVFKSDRRRMINLRERHNSICSRSGVKGNNIVSNVLSHSSICFHHAFKLQRTKTQHQNEPFRCMWNKKNKKNEWLHKHQEQEKTIWICTCMWNCTST